MRYAAKIDSNQSKIVMQLRDIPGVEVALKHDDILVGYKNLTYWFEVKNPIGLFKKDGVTYRKGKIKPSQKKIRATWTGHYSVVWSLDQILKEIGAV